MELPFLYQTRTILRPKARKLGAQLYPRYVSQSVCRRQENLDGSSFFRRKAAAVAANYAQDAPNTITREEQRAFNNLKRFAGRQEFNSGHTIDISEQDGMDVDPARILGLFTPPHPPHPSDTEDPSEDPSFDMISSLPGEATPPDSRPSPAQTIEMLTQQICTGEMQSFYKAAREALTSRTQPGDLALYTLVEKRIFPLLDILATQPRSRKSNKQQQTKADATANAATAKSSDHQPAPSQKQPPSPALQRLISEHLPQASQQTSAIPPLNVLTRLYPSLLLLSFRLLVKHHPLSAQTHRLLPQIRQLGPSSYILGATTPFYNTHLMLRWNVYSSLSEICSLLSEMERGAVEFDRGTSRALKGIADERFVELRAFGGETGSRGREWWLAPEQQRWWGKVEEWRRLVARQLEERGLGEVLREGPDTATASHMDGGPTSGAAEDLPQVWL